MMTAQQASRLYILDTNVLLHDPKCLYEFKEQDISIPMTVLEELDDIKDRKKTVAQEARHAIRSIDSILSAAGSAEDITKGVRIRLPGKEREEKLGQLSIFPDHELSMKAGFLPDERNKDNKIINCALHLQMTYPHREVVLVTKDINMRLKAMGAGLKRVEDYRTDQLVSDLELLPKGHRYLDRPFWDQVENVQTYQKGSRVYHTVTKDCLPDSFLNEYIYDSSEDFAARVVAIDEQTITLLDLDRQRLMEQSCWGIAPINIQQAFAMQSILDDTLDLSVFLGSAGSGKTLIALACALELVIEKRQYNKILVTRSTPPIAEEIGFLPGTEEEKMTPWMAAISDNLEAMHKDDDKPQSSIKYALEKGNIQFKSLNFIRGRSIQDAVVLIDEAQNLTPQQLKTIITRCGHGTKLICLGNLAQIDSNYLTPLTSGLTYIVECFRDYEGSASVLFEGVFRSRLAEYAEEHL